MQLEHVACPLCGEDHTRDWGQENGLTAVKCLECGLVYVNPRPLPDAISEGTRLGAHEIEDGELDLKYQPRWRRQRRDQADVKAAFATEIAEGKPLRWLDVGAGYGEFVYGLGKVLPPGSEVIGVEPMEPKVAYAQSKGLNVSSQSLSEVEGQFDVVSLMNVFSHVPDFRAFLAEMRALIKPGGSFYMRTGTGGDLESSRSYPDKLLLPNHLVFAGRQNINRFFSEAGLQVEWETATRLDGVKGFAKAIAKRAMRRPAPLFVPYASKFRDIRVRARVVAAPITAIPSSVANEVGHPDSAQEKMRA